MRCLRILLLTTICPILRYYIKDGGGGVGGKVAGIKITPGVRRDAGRGAPGETQVAGREARAGRGTRGTGGSRSAARDARGVDFA
jgi:hypothetical protein